VSGSTGPVGGPGSDNWISGLEPESSLTSTNTNQALAAAISDYLNVSKDGLLPTLAPPVRGGLSLESLVQALGNEERKTALKTGMATLEDRKKEIAETNEKKHKEIQARVEQMEKKGLASKFLKAFKIIGIVLGAIAGVAAIVAGALTANPVLVAGGIILSVMAADSILSEVTDGKISINNGMYLLAKKCGGSDNAAKWVGLITTLVLQLTGSILTGVGAMGVGSAAAKATATATEVAVTATKELVDKVSKVGNLVTSIMQGLNSVGTAATGIYVGSLEKDIGYSLANTKELNAILEKLKAAMELEKDLLEAILKKYQSLVEKTTDIINANNEAQTAVLTGEAFSSPSMA
jgi:hypothetical protein